MMLQLRSFICLTAIFLASLLFAGCNNTLSKQYGLSEGYEVSNSPASVSLFRNMCNETGHTTLLVKSFSPRAMKKLNAIVWTPDAFELHQPETLEWIDRWLASGDRTLVYVGRDFSPTADYWSQSAEAFFIDEVSNQDAVSALEQQAMELTHLEQLRSRVRSKTATPWCLIDHSGSVQERVRSIKGPWADSIDPTKARIFLRSHPVGYTKKILASAKKDFDREAEDTSTKAITTATTTTTTTTTKPKTSTSPRRIPIPTPPSTAADYDFKWQTSDANILKYVNAITASDIAKLKSRLSTGDDKPLIAEVTKSSWRNSRVFVVSNSSLLSNISLTNNENLSIAKKLADELPRTNIGFLGGTEDPIVRTDDSSDQQKGFEMLTIWPLNVVSIHAVFLGMLVLLAVFPIFGRAKQLPKKSTREFGQHIEAVGALLHKSRDRFYALATIAEYFRNVRKEPTSTWAKVDPIAQQEPKSPFKI